MAKAPRKRLGVVGPLACARERFSGMRAQKWVKSRPRFGLHGVGSRHQAPGAACPAFSAPTKGARGEVMETSGPRLAPQGGGAKGPGGEACSGRGYS